MKIVVFEIEDWECEAFEGLDEDHAVTFEKRALDAETAGKHADAQIVSTFIYSKLDAEVLERLPELEMIATRSTGFDHIDTNACSERDITVCNVPSYGENTVAEHVFALLLAISHRIIEAVDRTRGGSFSPEGLQGFDLRGRTLGVIGTGHIGRHVIKIAKGFGMRVLAQDVKPDDELAERLDFDYVPIDELLADSDIVTVHVPGSESTHHLIGADRIERMKDGAVLINTSRGTVVDNKALVEALARDQLAAAGLDVLPEEPAVREESELLRSGFSERHDLAALLIDHILMHRDDVIVTPHSAFNTREAVQRILDTTRDNIRSFLEGAPQNTVP